ncbi:MULTISPECIES: xanthine dehydrogenase family protein molybdopterin-binding subunit [unclassified Polaromonas]|uniref:xanthine dehydrogenase family protein molybdopterin-binding subunit n=1 Tax=unclassified Polaromonas TaxID=2638319 RepID=UPI000BC746E8|nr:MULTISPECIES: xanthine dehydrogenase family protein molybdopterin-binding subunit [unclassified Polaromonas]OYY32747.1 MAG: carbon monoxide dehydrogenase [Polaromonas sp. 35-63-35]OYZ16163.1 MAG: carbon monoxide dehydrogenase [Polaromonas sp. 16-63-31]OYZ75972.1 MAG: carbon monoxide dehydrogenase [Polaromonas sp. 24-63-21]OZA53101.1 MAG: carbon monoxide dehydrogenase [Polaromonas sp. 17-63-33]OZA85411.1 MAG: carbon monoxide dehydrogenase [Polaromonas sp. 39-63-25]
MSTTPAAAIQPTRFGSGQAVRRLEDDALLAGAGQFTDDVTQPEQAALFFVRSPYPHARIVAVDSAAALAMPGVLKIVTGADLAAAGVKPIPGSSGFPRADGSPGVSPVRRVLAHERVRFVGEAVAAVVAQTLQQARDAAEAVMVDYDELPMVVDMNDATAPGAPALVPQAPDNIACETRYGSVEATAAAFAKARHVVALDIVNQRLHALSLEPRSVLVAFDQTSQRLTIRMSTQMPTGVRNSVCDALGMAQEQVRVVVGDVGGGFGMKTGVYPEDIAAAYCARALQRPVKWVAERSEEFTSAYHGRDVQSRAELALDEHGKILALRLASLANVGAYATGAGVAIQLLIGPWVQTSVYDIQTIDFHFSAVLTNTAPTSAYRGAGRPEAIFTMERLMDEAARQTGIDRIELRRRNFIQPAQMPYKNPMGQVYDTGKFESVMDQALVLADWKGFDARAAASAANGKMRGLGIATFLEWTGGNALEETVTVAVQADGMIEVFTAVNAMGQGIATTLTQLVVDAFGVPADQVRVVMGDTDRGNGFGSAGSRSLFTGGSAVRAGADKAIALGKQLAAKEFEAAAEDVVYAGGDFTVAGTDLRIGLFDLAGRQSDQRIFVDSTTTVAGPTWPNGCHISEVEVDPQTGHVAVVAYASVNDVGRVVNPMIVRGQLDGGAVQGIGQALCERMVYDRETGQPVTGSLMDYAAPRADTAPDFRTEMDQSTPCLNNPLGVKGVGELGTIGAGPTVVNAVADALARRGMAAQARALQMPISPARLWELMQAPS